MIMKFSVSVIAAVSAAVSSIVVVDGQSIRGTSSGGDDEFADSRSLQGIVATGSGSVIGGGSGNELPATNSVIGGGFNNTVHVLSSFDVIAGGRFNMIDMESSVLAGENAYNFIGGGLRNSIIGGSEDSTIVGGELNSIDGDISGSTIGAGKENVVKSMAYSTILGGEKNFIDLLFPEDVGYATICGGEMNVASGNYATIGAGQSNTAFGDKSVVPMGRDNQAFGNSAIAMGSKATARFARSFVLNTAKDAMSVNPVESTEDSEFVIAAERFIFHIEKTRAILNKDNMFNVQDALLGRRRDLNENEEEEQHLTTEKIRDLIEETKAKHEDQIGTISNLRKKLQGFIAEYEEKGYVSEKPKIDEDDEQEMVVEAKSNNEKEYDEEILSRHLQNLPNGMGAVNPGGFNNSAVGTMSVVNGGNGNRGAGTGATVLGGRKNTARGDGNVAGGGEDNWLEGQRSVIGGGKKNEGNGEEAFIGGGHDNVNAGPRSAIGGGQKNKVTRESVESCVAGGTLNKAKRGYAYVAGGYKNRAEGEWSGVLGGERSFTKKQYGLSIGRKAQSWKNHAVAIALEPDGKRKAYSNQPGDFVIRSRVIEFRVGATRLVLDANNILKWKKLLKGTKSPAARRKLAKSEDELILLKELEEYEDLVDEQIDIMDELEVDIEAIKLGHYEDVITGLNKEVHDHVSIDFGQ